MRYEADASAPPVDRQLMNVAQSLEDNGHHEDAEIVAGAAAELREFMKIPTRSTTELYAVVERVHGAAASVMEVIARNFPPPSK